jgi:hypothetical protein
MSDGDWSDYVADAATDPAALSEASSSMGDTIDAAQAGLDSIDPSTLPDAAADGVSAAAANLDEAAGWQQWSDGDAANAASWRDYADGHVQAANEWAAWGNLDAAQEELNSAQTASELADDASGNASVDLGIGADYLDTAADNLSDAASDSNP